jgi:hypothetical protein
VKGRRRIAAFLLLGALGGAGCAKKADEGGEMAASTPPSSPARMEKKPADTHEEGGRSVIDQAGKEQQQIRKIVRTGSLQLTVDDYDKSRGSVDAMVTNAGGFIASSQVEHHDGSVSSATLVLRVPAARYDEVLRALRPLGAVTSESTNAEDISEQYYDTEARLRNAQKLETRMLDLIEHHTGPIADLLAVENELSRVREQIETMQGRMKTFDTLVAMSTINLSLQTRGTYVAVAKPTLGQKAVGSLHDSAEALANLGTQIVLFLAAMIPWTPVLALAVILLLRATRRRATRALASRTPSSSSAGSSG